MTPPVQTDSSEGRARVVRTARQIRHDIRNSLNMIALAESMLRMAVFRGDLESLDAIRIGIDRLVTDSDQLYYLATGTRGSWWRRASRWLFG